MLGNASKHSLAQIPLRGSSEIPSMKGASELAANSSRFAHSLDTFNCRFNERRGLVEIDRIAVGAQLLQQAGIAINHRLNSGFKNPYKKQKGGRPTGRPQKTARQSEGHRARMTPEGDSRAVTRASRGGLFAPFVARSATRSRGRRLRALCAVGRARTKSSTCRP